MRTALIMTLTILGLVLGASPAPATSPEQLVSGWYDQYLGRAAFADELPYWTDQMRQGALPDGIRAGILASEEYYCRRGKSPEGFVNGLYADVLGRKASEREVGYWLERFQLSACRKDVAKEFVCATNRDAAQTGPVGLPILRPEPEVLRVPLRIER